MDRFKNHFCIPTQRWEIIAGRDASEEGIAEGYARFIAISKQGRLDAFIEEILRINNSHIRGYHAGAIDYLLESGTGINGRDFFLKDALAELGKETGIHIATPYTDAKKIILALMEGFTQGQEKELDIPIPISDNVKGMLAYMQWETVERLHVRSDFTLLDLISERTTGSYVELANSLDGGSQLFLMFNHGSYLMEDPLIRIAYDRSKENVIEIRGVSFSGSGIPDHYYDAAKLILRQLNDGKERMQNKNERVRLQELAESFRIFPGFKDHVSVFGNKEHVRIYDTTGRVLPWAVAYIECLRKEEREAVAIVPNPDGIYTYFRAKGIPLARE